MYQNLLYELHSDIRFRLGIWVLVLLQLLDEALDLFGVFGSCGPELRAVLTNKPLTNTICYELIRDIKKTPQII